MLGEVETELNERKDRGTMLPVLQYPHPMLSMKSEVVLNFKDPSLKSLLLDMVTTMLQTHAAGLAAIQVGVPLRVMVVRGNDGSVHQIINPVLKEVSQETVWTKEGCLSFLGLFLNVTRPARCVVEYFDENGERKTLPGDGLLGRAIQHEMDHLDGKTFLDKLGKLERQKALEKNKMCKRKNEQAIKRFKEREDR